MDIGLYFARGRFFSANIAFALCFALRLRVAATAERGSASHSTVAASGACAEASATACRARLADQDDKEGVG